MEDLNDVVLSRFEGCIPSLRRPRIRVTVGLTLALGIGANAAIFSVVRGVLLRPLVNRDANRLIYIHQSAPDIGVKNATFSIPEIRDIGAHSKTITRLGTFSTINFTVEGLGEPREIQGRDFTEADRRASERVVIISRASRSGCFRARTR